METKHYKFKVGDRVKFLRDPELPPGFKQNTDAVCEVLRIDDDEKPYRIQSVDPNKPIFEASISNIHCINCIESALILAEGKFSINRRSPMDMLGGEKSFELVYQNAPPNENRSTVIQVSNYELNELLDALIEYKKENVSF